MACVGSVDGCVQLNYGGGGVKMIHSVNERAARRTDNIEDCDGFMCEYEQLLQLVLSRGGHMIRRLGKISIFTPSASKIKTRHKIFRIYI